MSFDSNGDYHDDDAATAEYMCESGSISDEDFEKFLAGELTLGQLRELAGE